MILHHFLQDVHVPSHFLVARRMNSVCLDSSLVNEVSSVGPVSFSPNGLVLPSSLLPHYIFFTLSTGNPLPSILFLMSFIDHMVFNGLYVEYAIIDEAVPYGAMQQSSGREMLAQ